MEPCFESMRDRRRAWHVYATNVQTRLTNKASTTCILHPKYAYAHRRKQVSRTPPVIVANTKKRADLKSQVEQ